MEPAARRPHKHCSRAGHTGTLTHEVGQEQTCVHIGRLTPHTHTHTHTLTHTPGIKDADTFTRWRKHYMRTGCFRPDRRGRFTSGFLLRHDDLKDKLRQWILGRMKKDINILDVCAMHTHILTQSLPVFFTDS